MNAVANAVTTRYTNAFVYSVVMTVTASPLGQVDEAVGIVELRTNLGQIVDAAYHGGRITPVNRHGRRMAVIVPAQLYDELLAALDDQRGSRPR